MSLSPFRIRKKVIGLNIDILTYDLALHKIIEWGKNRLSGYVCFANVHMSIEAHWDKIFEQQVNAASLVLPDGVPIAKSVKIFYKGCTQERIAGMDAFPDLLKHAAQNKVKVFFFGSTQEELEKIKLKAEKVNSDIIIAGLLSPSFNEPLDKDVYFEAINNSGAGLVFVALGCPKQEKWMAIHSHKINAMLLGVGGAFSVYAETVKRAPAFIQRFGLEWLYRLFQEPGRLFKRYFITNTLFIYLSLKRLLLNLKK